MIHTLEAKNLSKTIKKTTIVHDVSLKVSSREIVGLLGPNGAGKTTSFYMICGLTDASSGSIYIDGEEVTQLPLSTRAKMGIGYLPQESSIFKDLTVEENLLIAGEAMKIESKVTKERIEDLLELFNIQPIRKRLGIQLSGESDDGLRLPERWWHNPNFYCLMNRLQELIPLRLRTFKILFVNSLTLIWGYLLPTTMCEKRWVSVTEPMSCVVERCWHQERVKR